jgi:hypothetical protein
MTGRIQGGGAPEECAADEQIGRLLNDYLDRRARGERISDDILLAEHPDLADVLARHLSTLRVLEPSSNVIQELLTKHLLTPSTAPGYAAELGNYRITGVIGRGGMGIVLRAIELPLNRPVALKILRPELSVDHRALVRFEHEAKAAAALRHPNIVTVHACGESNGTHYLAMELVDGPSLADVLVQQSALPTEETGRIFRELLQGLAAAHTVGLIHRDIKSSNILLDGPNRQVKIADFGLARIAASNTRVTMPQSAIGTPEYMSPEQARGDEDIDHRADLYSAGVVLYEMLTGRVPFKADTASAVIHAILNVDPPEPRTFNKSADRRLANFALCLMAKRREDRFGSAAAALTGLDRRRQIYLPAKWRARRRVLLTIVVILVGLGAAWRMGLLRATVPPIARVKVDETLPSRILVEHVGSTQPTEFYRFKDGIRVTAAEIVDRNGRGDVIVVAGTEPAVEGNCLFAFEPGGTCLWQNDLSDDTQWPDCGPPTLWRTRAIIAGDLDGKPGDEVVVLATDRNEYPSRVSIVDPRTSEIAKTFWHFGQPHGALLINKFFDGQRPAIVVWGVNNKLRAFSESEIGDRDHLATYQLVPIIAILDPADITGTSPPRSKRLPQKPTRPPFAYAFLDVPSSEQGKYVDLADGELKEPSPKQILGIDRIEADTYLSDESTGPWLTLFFTGKYAHGGRVTVDRNLTFRHAVSDSSEEIAKDEQFWLEHWHPIVQNRKYVEE